MKSIKILLAIGIASILVFSFTNKTEIVKTNEEEAVKKLVYKAYINGAFNELDTDAMRKGFHKDFSIYTANGEELRKYEIADWIASKEKKKSDDYDPKDEKNI
ncbi:MAG: nuclear transport factor 2 family protein, partial [Bacteroidota bacterium]